MRPLKLKISAFGPYSEELSIDMDSLGNSGLYLITGDTGAGKTTIFDAITYALYGEASGTSRDKTMLRSKYAKDEVATFVMLEFEYAGKIYHIERNPEYMRTSKRGTGLTVQKAQANLVLPSGEIVTSVGEVNAKINDIMGIDQKQFSQIAMIAQGEFLKLIHASTEERQKIFRTIFSTQYYQKFQDKLKSEVSSLNREKEILDSGVYQYVNEIVCDYDEFEEKIKFAKNREYPIDETIQVLKSIIKLDEKSYKQVNDDIAKLEKEILALQETIKNNDEIKQKKSQKLSLVNSVKASEDELSVFEKKANVIDENTKEIKLIEAKLSVLESVISNYAQLDKMKAEFEKKETSFENVSTQVSSIQKLISKLKSDITNQTDELKLIQNVKIDLIQAKNEKLSLENTKLKISTLTDEITKLNKLECDFKSSQTDYVKAQETAQKYKADFELKSRAYFDSQAGILAQTLTQGQPCPVCGSTHHINPAILSENAPSKDELDSAKDESEKANEKMQQSSEKAGELKIMLSAQKDVVIALSSDLELGSETENLSVQVENILSDNNKQIELIKEKISKLEKAEKRQEELQKLIEKNENDLISLESDFTKENEQMISLRKDCENLKLQLEDMANKLEFKSKNDADEFIENQSKKILDLQNEVDLIKNTIKSKREEIISLESKLETLNQQLENSVELSSSELDEKLLCIKQDKLNATTLQQTLHSKIDGNSKRLSGILSKSEELIELEKRLTWMSSLSRTANASLSGKEKIMLETYIQMNYFDRIISRANVRLMKMTNGQFELLRRTETENKRSQSGLELDVIDHNNASIRSVKSLSGGESFKASLSLALGLSDEIQSFSGGIQLDTMFVDEGFGALDDESLQMAIKVLMELAGGNKLIGIISHVNELKENIDKKILVTKDKANGSNIEIILE